LERLKHDKSFSTILTGLRSEGWLDWHFLSAINGITLNYRTLLHPNARGNPDVMKRVFSALMRRPENDTDPPVPLGSFTEERMRGQLRINMLGAINNLGLVCRQDTPDLSAIEHFLRHRYNYWTYDIDHPPL
jgi:hypothetical protein